MSTTIPSRVPRVFRPNMDWWVAFLVLLFVFFLAAGIPLMLWTELISRAAALVTSLILFGVIIYFIDIAFYSVYVLDDEGLTIVSHLRQAMFPYRNMRALQPGGVLALFSFARRKRFALSRKNVIIKLAGSPWNAISVSPRDRDVFINQILERIDHERSRRSARQRHVKNKQA